MMLELERNSDAMGPAANGTHTHTHVGNVAAKESLASSDHTRLRTSDL